MELLPTIIVFLSIHWFQWIICVESNNSPGLRDSKSFPFWAFVNIPEDACLMDSSEIPRGTCVNSKLCKSLGSEVGTCAKGFGVCCEVKLSAFNEQPVIVTNKVTTLTNENNVPVSKFLFPRNHKQGRVIGKVGYCRVRLDFLNGAIGAPATGASKNAGDCTNQRVILPGNSNTLDQDMIICGDLSGQHAYLSFNSKTHEDLVLTVESEQAFQIRATYVHCDQAGSERCLQYFTKSTDIVKSFNYIVGPNGQHLNNQHYRVCVSTQQSGSFIQWKPCDESATSRSFFVTGNYDLANPIIDPIAKKGDQCNTDFVQIINTKYCGSLLHLDAQEKSRLIHGDTLVVSFDHRETGDDILSFPCTGLPTAMDGYVCIYDDTTDLCSCTVDPTMPYHPEIAAPAPKFVYEVATAEDCPASLGPFQHCAFDTGMCSCVFVLTTTDLYNNGFCLVYNVT